jgi:hypothetical protein
LEVLLAVSWHIGSFCLLLLLPPPLLLPDSSLGRFAGPVGLSAGGFDMMDGWFGVSWACFNAQRYSPGRLETVSGACGLSE